MSGVEHGAPVTSVAPDLDSGHYCGATTIAKSLMVMKRMLMRIRIVGLSWRRLTLLWCLVAAGFLSGEPISARAQAIEHSKATEQLFEAVHANDFAAVQASVAAGADVDAFDRWGMTPMELAIDKGYFEIGHYLVAVRNFSRANAEQGPAPQVSPGSPFDAAPSGNVASRPPGPSSPLGPMTKPADKGGSAPTVSSDVEMETSAGRSGDREWSTDTANPFDPNAPAHGSGVFTAGESGGTATKSFSASAENRNASAGKRARGTDPMSASAATGLPQQTSETPADDLPDGAEASEFSNRVIGVGGESQ